MGGGGGIAGSVIGGILGGGGNSTGGSGTGPGRNALKRIVDLQDRLYSALDTYSDRAAPFFGLEQRRGQFGESFFPDLSQAIRNPTTSPAYKLALNEGLDALRNKFAATGSPSSGPAQIAAGRFAAGLEGNAFDRSMSLLPFAVSQRGQLPVTQEPQFFGIGAQNLATLMQGRAAQRAEEAGKGFGPGQFLQLIDPLGSKYLYGNLIDRL